jgi:pre-mRNA-splicing factor ISY1
MNKLLEEWKEKDPSVDYEIKYSTEKEMKIGEGRFIAHVPVPSQKDIEQALLNRRKRELLAAFVDDNVADDVAE